MCSKFDYESDNESEESTESNLSEDDLSEESKVKRQAFYDLWDKNLQEHVRRNTKTIHFVYRNGNTYDGDLYCGANPNPNGKGTMKFVEYKGEVSREAPDSGFFLATYKGDWSYGEFHGHGELRYGYGSLKDNDFYIGNWALTVDFLFRKIRKLI